MTQKRRHLLLTSLGISVNIVLEVLDWLKNPELWDHVEDHPSEKFSGVDELWVITTKSQRRVAQELHDIIKNNAHWKVPNVMIGYTEISDITSNREHNLMSELLYRLVLKGQEWKRSSESPRTFSICIAGGRKTMSSALQEAANFFDVDGLFHVVDTGKGPLPKGWSFVEPNKEKRAQFYPLTIDDTTSPWSQILEYLWDSTYSESPLTTEFFGIEMLPDPEFPDIYKLQISRDSKNFFLQHMIRHAAGKMGEFLKKGLSAGIRADMIRHDLRSVFDSLLNAPPPSVNEILDRIEIISDYFKGLELATSQGLSFKNDLRKLIPKALYISTGEMAKNIGSIWTTVELEVKIAPPQPTAPQTANPPGKLSFVSPIPNEQWLVILRNIFSNIIRYGAKKSGKAFASIELQTPPPNDYTLLTIRNPITPSTYAELSKVQKARGGNLSYLLQPGVKGTTKNKGTGLGLFGIKKIVELYDNVEISGPKVSMFQNNPSFEISFTIK